MEHTKMITKSNKIATLLSLSLLSTSLFAQDTTPPVAPSQKVGDLTKNLLLTHPKDLNTNLSNLFNDLFVKPSKVAGELAKKEATKKDCIDIVQKFLQYADDPALKSKYGPYKSTYQKLLAMAESGSTFDTEFKAVKSEKILLTKTPQPKLEKLQALVNKIFSKPNFASASQAYDLITYIVDLDKNTIKKLPALVKKDDDYSAAVAATKEYAKIVGTILLNGEAKLPQGAKQESSLLAKITPGKVVYTTKMTSLKQIAQGYGIMDDAGYLLKKTRPTALNTPPTTGTTDVAPQVGITPDVLDDSKVLHLGVELEWAVSTLNKKTVTEILQQYEGIIEKLKTHPAPKNLLKTNGTLFNTSLSKLQTRILKEATPPLQAFFGLVIKINDLITPADLGLKKEIDKLKKNIANFILSLVTKKTAKPIAMVQTFYLLFAEEDATSKKKKVSEEFQKSALTINPKNMTTAFETLYGKLTTTDKTDDVKTKLKDVITAIKTLADKKNAAVFKAMSSLLPKYQKIYDALDGKEGIDDLIKAGKKEKVLKTELEKYIGWVKNLVISAPITAQEKKDLETLAKRTKEIQGSSISKFQDKAKTEDDITNFETETAIFVQLTKMIIDKYPQLQATLKKALQEFIDRYLFSFKDPLTASDIVHIPLMIKNVQIEAKNDPKILLSGYLAIAKRMEGASKETQNAEGPYFKKQILALRKALGKAINTPSESINLSLTAKKFIKEEAVGSTTVIDVFCDLIAKITTFTIFAKDKAALQGEIFELLYELTSEKKASALAKAQRTIEQQIKNFELVLKTIDQIKKRSIDLSLAEAKYKTKFVTQIKNFRSTVNGNVMDTSDAQAILFTTFLDQVLVTNFLESKKTDIYKIYIDFYYKLTDKTRKVLTKARTFDQRIKNCLSALAALNKVPGLSLDLTTKKNFVTRISDISKEGIKEFVKKNDAALALKITDFLTKALGTNLLQTELAQKATTILQPILDKIKSASNAYLSSIKAIYKLDAEYVKTVKASGKNSVSAALAEYKAKLPKLNLITKIPVNKKIGIIEKYPTNIKKAQTKKDLKKTELDKNIAAYNALTVSLTEQIFKAKLTEYFNSKITPITSQALETANKSVTELRSISQ